MMHRKGTLLVEGIRPLYARVSYYTCRRSFCTNEYLAEVPVESTLHKSDGMKKVFRSRKYGIEAQAVIDCL